MRVKDVREEKRKELQSSDRLDTGEKHRLNIVIEENYKRVTDVREERDKKVTDIRQ